MMKEIITKTLIGLCLFCLAATCPLQAGKYKSFKVSVYARAYEVDKMKDLHWLDSTWTVISRQVILSDHREGSALGLASW